MTELIERPHNNIHIKDNILILTILLKNQCKIHQGPWADLKELGGHFHLTFPGLVLCRKKHTAFAVDSFYLLLFFPFCSLDNVSIPSMLATAELCWGSTHRSREIRILCGKPTNPHSLCPWLARLQRWRYRIPSDVLPTN
jgi:hypothetical protein